MRSPAIRTSPTKLPDALTTTPFLIRMLNVGLLCWEDGFKGPWKRSSTGSSQGGRSEEDGCDRSEAASFARCIRRRATASQDASDLAHPECGAFPGRAAAEDTERAPS